MRSRVAVVLSGGGAKGAYEAGALLPIVRRNSEISIVTGASIGAINAALFASVYDETGDPVRAVEDVQKVWREIGSLFRLDVSSVILKALMRAIAKGDLSLPGILSIVSLVDNSAIVRKIGQIIPDKKISDIKRVDLAIAATDVTNGRIVTFTRDDDISLQEAVLASSCIPLLLPARTIDGVTYIDGGVFNNTPLRDALVLGATDVFVVGLKPKEKATYFETIVETNPIDSVFEMGARLMELILDKIMYDDLKRARQVNKLIEVIHKLEGTEENEAMVQLKEAIGYDKRNAKYSKRIVNFYEIAPSARLDPPGTLGFEKKDEILAIMELGKEDAMAQLQEQMGNRYITE